MYVLQWLISVAVLMAASYNGVWLHWCK